MQPACHNSLRQVRRSRVLPWALALSLHLAEFVFLAHCTLGTRPGSGVTVRAVVTLKLQAQPDAQAELTPPPLELPEIVETASSVAADLQLVCYAIENTTIERAAPVERKSVL